MGGGAALRVPSAVPEGHAGAALPAGAAAGRSLDLGELAELARAWERGVDELAAEDTEVAEYVSALEQQQDAAELPEASGEAIAAEFERYLRRRQGN